MLQIARKITEQQAEHPEKKRETSIHKAFRTVTMIGSCCANTFKFWTGFCRCPPRKKKALRRKAIKRVPHSIRLESCMQQARYGVVLARPSGSMFEGPRFPFILHSLLKDPQMHKIFSIEMVHIELTCNDEST